ncbi:MAG: redoxin domain-containing protein [Bacteroidales bacterium]|nr:redoxin domain-containing protein [Bacteroidales bacterium]
MKHLLRIFTIWVSAMLACAGTFHAGAQGLDSLRAQALETKLDEYFRALDYENPEFKKQECDFLVGSCSDSLVRQFVALRAYEHYAGSPVMGDEAVAIHIFDKWFLSGMVRMRDDGELLRARIFADFNRSSLIGMTAPSIAMQSLEGSTVELFSSGDACGTFRVLYFYDTGCSKCRLETLMLRNLFTSGDFPVEFYAIYSGDNEEKWREYASEEFGTVSGRTGIVHLWDPGLDSDFQRKYGVLATPRLFLVAPDWTIVGRGLDAAALGRMLDMIFSEKELEYGSDESVALFDGMFTDGAVAVTSSDVADVADRIASATLDKGDTVMFRQMEGDLLYYLSSKTGEGFKDGTAYLIRTYIKERADIWGNSSDSLKIIGFADILDDLLSKAEPGTFIADVSVPGRLLSSKGEKDGHYSLRSFGKKRGIVIFHTEGCPYCEAEIEAAARLVKSDRQARVLLVNMDDIFETDTVLAETLFDAFDLSSLPFLIEIDKKGKIVRRYFSL